MNAEGTLEENCPCVITACQDNWDKSDFHKQKLVAIDEFEADNGPWRGARSMV